MQIECLTGNVQASSQPGPVDITAPENADSPGKTTTTAVPVFQVLPPKTSEVTVKSEMVALTEPAENVAKPEELGSRDTCSDSISSEILDTDSPRTMESAPFDKIDVYPHISSISTDILMDSNISHMGDHLCEHILSPQVCQRISVKVEDGSLIQNETSCNYILTQLDEERGLPWWDWP